MDATLGTVGATAGRWGNCGAARRTISPRSIACDWVSIWPMAAYIEPFSEICFCVFSSNTTQGLAFPPHLKECRVEHPRTASFVWGCPSEEQHVDFSHTHRRRSRSALPPFPNAANFPVITPCCDCRGPGRHTLSESTLVSPVYYCLCHVDETAPLHLVLVT